MNTLVYRLNLAFNKEFRNSTIRPIESGLRRQIEDRTWSPLYLSLMRGIESKVQPGEKEDV